MADQKPTSVTSGIDKTRSRNDDENNQHWRKYTYPDGHSETYYGGSRAWRNHNPGNLKNYPFATEQGSIGDDGTFAIFPDYATGRDAAKALLKTDVYQELTLKEAIAKYSPATENNTARSQKLIQQFSGLDLKRDMNSLTDTELETFMKAIERVEQHRKGQIVIEPAKENQRGQTLPASDSDKQIGQTVSWESLTEKQQVDLKPLGAWNKQGFERNSNAKGMCVSSTDARGHEKTIQLFAPEEMKGRTIGMNAQETAVAMHQQIASAQRQQETEQGPERERSRMTNSCKNLPIKLSYF